MLKMMLLRDYKTPGIRLPYELWDHNFSVGENGVN